MDDGRTEPFEPYQPETSYEWDYEDEPPKAGAPKILWGRVVTILVVVLLAFLLGRATGGGGGVDQAQYDKLKRQYNSVQQQLAAALASPDPDPQQPTNESPAPAESPDANASQAPPGTKTYEVQPGDTLRGIAEHFYKDASLDDLIATANGITDPASIRPGQVLTIPPKP